MTSLEPSDPADEIAPILEQIKSLADQRRAFEQKAEKLNEQRAPIDRALKTNDERTANLRRRLKTAMEAADEKSVSGNGISAVIIAGRTTEIVDESAAVAAITELGRLKEITKVTYDKVGIKRISDGQIEPLPGIEVVETRTLRVTIAP